MSKSDRKFSLKLNIYREREFLCSRYRNLHRASTIHQHVLRSDFLFIPRCDDTWQRPEPDTPIQSERV